jgi:hypothetical protein
VAMLWEELSTLRGEGQLGSASPTR